VFQGNYGNLRKILFYVIQGTIGAGIVYHPYVMATVLNDRGKKRGQHPFPIVIE
jgi:hypothetical protein